MFGITVFQKVSLPEFHTFLNFIFYLISIIINFSEIFHKKFLWLGCKAPILIKTHMRFLKNLFINICCDNMYLVKRKKFG